jgi:hypothetical protein
MSQDETGEPLIDIPQRIVEIYAEIRQHEADYPSGKGRPAPCPNMILWKCHELGQLVKEYVAELKPNLPRGINAYEDLSKATKGKLSRAQLYSYAKFARQPKYVVEMLVAEGRPWREAAKLSAKSVEDQESDLDIRRATARFLLR